MLQINAAPSELQNSKLFIIKFVNKMMRNMTYLGFRKSKSIIRMALRFRSICVAVMVDDGERIPTMFSPSQFLIRSLRLANQSAYVTRLTSSSYQSPMSLLVTDIHHLKHSHFPELHAKQTRLIGPHWLEFPAQGQCTEMPTGPSKTRSDVPRMIDQTNWPKEGGG